MQTWLEARCRGDVGERGIPGAAGLVFGGDHVGALRAEGAVRDAAAVQLGQRLQHVPRHLPRTPYRSSSSITAHYSSWTD